MYRKSTYVICILFLAAALANATFNNASISKNFRKPMNIVAPPQGYTGTTAGLYCNTSGCHSTFTLNTVGGSITASALPAAYTAGTAYKFSVTIKHSAADRKRWGFSIAARNSAGLTVGTFSSTNPNAAPNGNELSHFNAVITDPAQSTFTYNNLTWTAPSTVGTSDNNITFYIAGVAANNDATSVLDYVYTTTKSACALPAQPGAIAGSGSVCAGSTKTYSIAAVPGATSYKWTVPTGATISGPKTGTSIKVIFGSTGGKLKVKAINACGSSKQKAKNITVTTCFAFEPGDESENATTNKGFGVSVYPNPTQGNLKVRFESLKETQYSIRVVDFMGKQVINTQGKTKTGLNEVDLNLGSFSKGVYLVQLQQQNGESFSKKIVLQ